MHSLKVVYAIAIALALAVAAVVTHWAPRLEGGQSSGPIVAGAIAFFAVAAPATILFLALLRFAKDAETVRSRIVRAATGDVEEAISDGDIAAEELSDVLRAADELRSVAVRQRVAFDREREETRDILSNLGEALLAVNESQAIVFANASFYQLFGTVDDIGGRRLSEIVRNATVIESIDRALSGSEFSTRFQLHHGGDSRSIELRVFPVARSGEVAAVALFIDVTRIERLERMRREFLDDFSHEARTPLAGLKAAIETFSSGSLRNGEEAHLHAIMERQISRIERLISDLSELSGIESGELTLRRKTVDLHELAKEAASEFSELQPSRRIEVSGSSALVLADPVRIGQIISNLLDNALKHGAGVIELTTGTAAGQAFLRVADEGGGIPVEQREKVFQRFFRGDRSRSQSVPGTGLGLAITKHLVLLHGGTIRVADDASRTIVEVRLPLPEPRGT